MNNDTSRTDIFAEKNYRSILIALFILAFALRVVQITWGSPYLDKYSSFFNKDEYKMLQSLHHFPFELEKERIVHDPMLNTLISSTFYPLKIIVNKIFSPPAAEGIYEFSIRLLFILFSVATAFLIVRFVLLISGNRFLALSAGFLFAVAPISVETAARIKPGPVLCFLLTLFLYYSYKLDRGLVPLNTKSVAKLAVIFGLAIGTKYTAVLYTPVFLYLARKPLLDKEYLNLLKYTFLVVILVTGIFFLNIPSAVMDINVLPDTYAYMKKSVGSSYSSEMKIITSFQRLSRAAGIPLFLLGAVGFICQLKNIRKYAILYFALIIFFLFSSTVPLPRMFIPIIPIIVILGALTLNEVNRKLALLIMGIILIGSLALDGAIIGYKINDNRRKTSKYLESLPETTGFLMGTRKHNPRIPHNIKWDASDPEYIVLTTLSLEGLIKQLKDTGIMQKMPDEDWAIFSGQKALNIQFQSNKYRNGYPTNLREYFMMKRLFTTDKYRLEKTFITDSNFFTRYCSLVQWEPKVYIYRKN